jgi:NADPH-dependent curcumin reductase CurA
MVHPRCDRLTCGHTAKEPAPQQIFLAFAPRHGTPTRSRSTCQRSAGSESASQATSPSSATAATLDRTQSTRPCGGFGSFCIVGDLTNRRILLRRRPTGLVAPGDTELVSASAPEPADGEALLRATYVGIDAAVRTWLNDQPGYLPPVQLGEVIRAAGIGEIVATRCDAYAVGDVVTTLTGFQEYVIIRDDVFSTPVPGDAVDQLAVMSVYGPTGATAYFGMTGIGRPQSGETVVVSAAAGATGSVAGQIAKIAGARVVGIAGGPDKCRAVVEDFGFDACIDYREDDVPAALKQHCPGGVDVYFDNVGGPILDAVLGRLAPKARVVLCGVISSYLTGEHPGPANYVNLLAKSASMQGFNTLDQWGRFDEAFGPLRQWEQEGRLVHRQTIFEGIESCVDALNGLFTGANIGKMLVKVSEPTSAGPARTGD